MKHVVTLSWLLAAAICGGCKVPPSPFVVEVRAMTDEGDPVGGMRLTIGTKQCNTNPKGFCSVSLQALEGTRIKIKEEVPKGYTKISTKDTVTLQRMNDIKQQDRQLPIEHSILLSPTARRYAILVDAQLPNLSIETFGAQRAVTNS